MKQHRNRSLDGEALVHLVEADGERVRRDGCGGLPAAVRGRAGLEGRALWHLVVAEVLLHHHQRGATTETAVASSTVMVLPSERPSGSEPRRMERRFKVARHGAPSLWDAIRLIGVNHLTSPPRRLLGRSRHRRGIAHGDEAPGRDLDDVVAGPAVRVDDLAIHAEIRALPVTTGERRRRREEHDADRDARSRREAIALYRFEQQAVPRLADVPPSGDVRRSSDGIRQ